jgi:phosphoribosylamine--glycine ligase
MKILVVGSGGREHALVWKLKQSKKVTDIFVAPGNAGTAEVAKNIKVSNINDVVKWVKKNPVDLVIIGPDDYLAGGIVNKLQKLNIPVFGPTKEASQIEWSKSFAKSFMQQEGIPTAQFKTFTNIKEAKLYVKDKKYPLVIKVDGLALGKGVFISKSVEEANDALEKIMTNQVFGSAGNEVLIEEFLEGREISVHAFCDGNSATMFPSSQDHKKIFEGDEGPNTGGMGTIAPVPGITDIQIKEIKEKIILPTLLGLKERGKPFQGVLFPGIMLTKSGPKVIEFNARFGDPETQSYMRILKTDLVEIILSCISGKLETQQIKWSDEYASCVILASGGYPLSYKKGFEIQGLEENGKDKIEIFHSGTSFKKGKVVTNGGRVLGITSTDTSLEKSLLKTYKAIEIIHFDEIYFRKDIGSKAVKLLNN